MFDPKRIRKQYFCRVCLRNDTVHLYYDNLEIEIPPIQQKMDGTTENMIDDLLKRIKKQIMTSEPEGCACHHCGIEADVFDDYCSAVTFGGMVVPEKLYENGKRPSREEVKNKRTMAHPFFIRMFKDNESMEAEVAGIKQRIVDEQDGWDAFFGMVYNTATRKFELTKFGFGYDGQSDCTVDRYRFRFLDYQDTNRFLMITKHALKHRKVEDWDGKNLNDLLMSDIRNKKGFYGLKLPF